MGLFGSKKKKEAVLPNAPSAKDGDIAVMTVPKGSAALTTPPLLPAMPAAPNAAQTLSPLPAAPSMSISPTDDIPMPEIADFETAQDYSTTDIPELPHFQNDIHELPTFATGSPDAFLDEHTEQEAPMELDSEPVSEEHSESVQAAPTNVSYKLTNFDIGNKPLFVAVEKYVLVLENVHIAKEEISHIHDFSVKRPPLTKKVDTAQESFHSKLEYIQKKVALIEQKLFSR
ncbi:MAG: hypothetical protein ACI8Y7_001199 [Candidatus Woesearchaeota archaeon]|jgi:hypothetical protein